MNECAQQIGSSAPAREHIGMLSLSVLTKRVGSREPTPGGGSVAAAVVALAASLGEMAARYAAVKAPDDPYLGEIVSLLGVLRDRGLHLADADIEAYARYVLATGISGEVDEVERGDARHAALSDAAEVPTELASIAVRVAEAGAGLFETGNPNLRSDAFTTAVLAAAAAQSAACFVAENLAWSRNDPRIAEARRLALQAAAAADRVANPDDSKDGTNL